MSEAAYKSTVAMSEDLGLRKMSVSASATAQSEATKEELDEQAEVNGIIEARKRYAQDRKGKEREWIESFKMYMSWVDRVVNPFLSNLFIPKTHEAVELLSAFLIGTNQSISASPENGSSDTMKSRVAGKYLDFLWRKVLKARIKILVWIKQAIIFGNGIIKFGWDPVAKKVWMSVCAIEDVYFDYFEADIQDSEYIIHEIRKDPEDVKNDTKYDIADKDGKLIRDQVIAGGQPFADQNAVMFSTFDGSLNRTECRGKVLIMEVWCISSNGEKQKLKTLLPTQFGWRVARRTNNPNYYKAKDGSEEQFRPFVKLRFKTAALPNRAYDMGAVFPTIHLQKAFNDLFRQYFDAVQIINNPMWLKRRGARINPSELIRRPGGIITVKDINGDLRSEQVGDVKQSIIEMLNRLDREFQEASMVVNLVKGISQSQTATGDAIAQQNVQTLLDMIDQNIVDALSEAGQMALAIALHNEEGVKSLVLYENEKELATLDFDPKNIDGMHDIRIRPDRPDNTSKAGQNQSLVKVYPLIASDAQIITKYPSIKEKLITRILENDGVGDPDYFFQEENPAPQPTGEGQGQQGPKPPSVSMSYKDAPDDVRREIEAAAGLQPSRMVQSPVKVDVDVEKEVVV